MGQLEGQHKPKTKINPMTWTWYLIQSIPTLCEVFLTWGKSELSGHEVCRGIRCHQEAKLGACRMLKQLAVEQIMLAQFKRARRFYHRKAIINCLVHQT